MRLRISCRFRLDHFCSTLPDACRSPHLRHMLLVPMSVHSLFRCFQLVSAHALSSTVHDSPRKFRTSTLKRALPFLPQEGERTPNSLINFLQWGLQGSSRQQVFPQFKAKAKAKAKASSSSDSDDSNEVSDEELFGKNSSPEAD